MPRKGPAAVAVLAGCALVLLAAAPSEGAGGTREELAREYRELSVKLHRLFGEKKYPEAEKTVRRLMEMVPDRADNHYNLACALARQGKADDALAELATSVKLGYRDAGHMRADEDLASLRERDEFKALAEKMAKLGPGAGARYEPGADIPGVKTVERNPEGGLRYRVRMNPGATPEKPVRLVIWLHPSGGSMNNVAERLAPRLVKSGFALMVLTQKQFMGWAAPEIAALLNKTLPDAGKIDGIDARRPVLMGYSAGGQAALSAWPENAAKFGGIILDAAYPIRQTAAGLKPLPIPPGEGVKSCPFFVLVGERDNGAALWRKTAPKWREAGIPLVLRFVAGKGHTWLFGADELAALDAWLAAVREGKLPSDGKAEVEPEPGAPGAEAPGEKPAGGD